MITSSTRRQLTLSDLICERGDQDLFQAVNFTLNVGEVLQVCGANGSGKTTLLRAICGLHQPRQGQVLWRDYPALKLAEPPFIAYLGHDTGIKQALTVSENLRVNLAGVSPPAVRVAEVLQQVGLAAKQDVLAGQLSAGQQRRLALARLLLSAASYWILDEPFAALDQRANDWLIELLQNFVKQGGSVILTSHQEILLYPIPIQYYSLIPVN